MQRQAAAMSLDDLAGQGQSQAGAVALGGIERYQRVLQDRFVHAAAAVEHLDAYPVRNPRQAQAHPVAGPGLMRILEQVEQRLFDLSRVDARMEIGGVSLQLETDLALQAGQERAPLDVLQQGLRQLGKACVAPDEAFQVARAFLDGGEYFPKPLMPTAPHQLAAGVRQ